MEKMSLEQADHFLRHIKIHAEEVRTRIFKETKGSPEYSSRDKS